MLNFLHQVNIYDAEVKVFDKNGNFLHSDDGANAFDWICLNAVGPDYITVKGVEGRFSIDDFAEELEKQMDEDDL